VGGERMSDRDGGMCGSMVGRHVSIERKDVFETLDRKGKISRWFNAQSERLRERLTSPLAKSPI